MSSLRNAVHRRAHKERSQPKERKRFGLLEKHKDYVVRAKAFHKKEDYLQKLKEKAAFRNPDEFYFKMINSKTVNGVHKQAGEANKYTEEELLLMKSQDIGYILQKVQSEKKKIERLTEHCTRLILSRQTDMYTMLKIGRKLRPLPTLDMKTEEDRATSAPRPPVTKKNKKRKINGPPGVQTDSLIPKRTA